MGIRSRRAQVLRSREANRQRWAPHHYSAKHVKPGSPEAQAEVKEMLSRVQRLTGVKHVPQEAAQAGPSLPTQVDHLVAEARKQLAVAS